MTAITPTHSCLPSLTFLAFGFCVLLSYGVGAISWSLVVFSSTQLRTVASVSQNLFVVNSSSGKG